MRRTLTFSLAFLGLAFLGALALAAPDRFNNDVYVAGNLSCATFSPPSGCVTDASIVSAANVAFTKLQHLQNHTYSQAGASNAAAERKAVHVSKNGGAVQSFDVGAVTAATGNATVVLDLQKNGTTVLTGTITLDNGTAAYALKSGTLSGTVTLSAGDVLEVVVTSPNAGSGALAKGLFGVVQVMEKGQ